MNVARNSANISLGIPDFLLQHITIPTKNILEGAIGIFLKK